MLLWTVLQFVVGAVLLIVGAEFLVRGASRLAAAFGISPLFIGLTVVAFGTSAPEIAVGLNSAWQGHADIALGNVIGSNICNVLLILGLSAMIVPLVVAKQLIWRDIPVMIGCGVLMLGLSLDGRLGRLDGCILFLVLVAYLTWTFRQGHLESEATPDFAEKTDLEQSQFVRYIAMQVVWVVGGLGLLTIGSRFLVQSAVLGAQALGFSELVISLTVVAVGTSLPEIATSILAAWRGERDLAVGNVIGSNLFNILAVLGLTAAIVPDGVSISPAALRFDFPVMLAIFVACLPICFTGHLIARWEGALFVSYYVAYTAYLILQATAHEALPTFSTIMVSFAFPLTVITLAISVFRSMRARRERTVSAPS